MPAPAHRAPSGPDDPRGARMGALEDRPCEGLRPPAPLAVALLCLSCDLPRWQAAYGPHLCWEGFTCRGAPRPRDPVGACFQCALRARARKLWREDARGGSRGRGARAGASWKLERARAGFLVAKSASLICFFGWEVPSGRLGRRFEIHTCEVHAADLRFCCGRLLGHPPHLRFMYQSDAFCHSGGLWRSFEDSGAAPGDSRGGLDACRWPAACAVGGGEHRQVTLGA